jgi:translation initiation factor IF-2
MFTPEMEKVSYGKAKVLQIFRTEKGEMIVGGRVDEGELRKNCPVAVWRGEDQLGTAQILELQQSKVATKTVDTGSEFGIKLKTTVKIEAGDKLESFEEVLKHKTL